MNVIAYRIRGQRQPVWYIANLPGRGGVDWGYSERVGDAIPLSEYWLRRLNADFNKIGAKYGAISCDEISQPPARADVDAAWRKIHGAIDARPCDSEPAP